MSSGIINSLIIAEIAQHGYDHLESVIRSYLSRSIPTIRELERLVETSEYERLAEEANFLKRIAASMGVTRVHVLSTSIAIQSKSNPLRHEHLQLVQQIRLLQRQNSRAEEELLHILSSRRRR
ncbi:hypothetical protein PGT21_013666 [Puccinia graminis f. sp. tritici]|uniref:HPt domain-containing protein n=1 Tax=Puccinia graminis f. sp. tritici TaxID=56615 RepID=A0A5B0S5Z8_PUCGR|nr:hypothetical protein PGT21_013666 [Puccinia graminis f. sp. tritici]KAA1132084.1 hypothetical protein PGTUg99_036903 [Puccinia graminis f. sp. tritici]